MCPIWDKQNNRKKENTTVKSFLNAATKSAKRICYLASNNGIIMNLFAVYIKLDC